MERLYLMPSEVARLRGAFLPVVVAAAVWSVPSQATDDGFKLNGAVRLRYEAIDGQARVGFNRNDALRNTRTNIMAQYRTGTVLFAVEIYDSRIRGDDAGTPVTTAEVIAIEPVQAYVAADILAPLGKGTKLTVTADRMMLNLGSRRLVAADDYRNTTNGYTGVRADLVAPQGIRATVLYTLPQMRLPDDPQALRNAKIRLDRESFDLVLWGGIISKANMFGTAMGELSYFHLGERDAPGRATRGQSIDTFGGRVIAEPRTGKVDYEVEAFYQTGHVSASMAATAARQTVSASFAHADIGYSFAGDWKPRLSIDLDRASGDKTGGDNGRFDTFDRTYCPNPRQRS